MSQVPSISTSALTALNRGFSRLNRGAAEIVSATIQTAPLHDSVDLRTTRPGSDDPLLTGIRDMMLARLEVGAGAALLHAYRANRSDLFELLRDE